MTGEAIEIRSYRRVFDLERRIYSVDQLRLNPGGVPVRGILYFAAVLLVGLLASSLPGIRELCDVLPWYARYVLIPGALSVLLGVIRLEGRTFHQAALALVRYRLGRRRLIGGVQRCPSPGEQWRPGEIVLLPDGSDGRLRRLRYSGPGTVLVLVEHERRERAPRRTAGAFALPGRRAALTLRGHSGAAQARPGTVIALAPGAHLKVSTAPRGGRG